jgi:nicotinate phosphoribosyltransferase
MKNGNGFVDAALTDLYQLTMIYAYWLTGKHNDHAVFDLFFRKNPFGGEYTIFAGLEEVVRYIQNFGFTDRQIDFLQNGRLCTTEELQLTFINGLNAGYIREKAGNYERRRYGPWGAELWEQIEWPDQDVFVEPPLKGCDPAFFEWLKTIDTSKMKVYAVREGNVVFPRLPLYRVAGPLAIGQMLETTMLNLTNFPSLVTTNAARMRYAAGVDMILLEFGLRRAQGPDGAISASRYSFIGGFNGTSNVKAGMLFGLPIRGTQAHAFISSFTGLADLKKRTLIGPDGREHDFVELVLKFRNLLGFTSTNEGELAAMIAYAQAFPEKFLALVDTYDTLKSGTPNYICVALALCEIGYKPVGIRLDSGDLAYLSKEARKMFVAASKKTGFDISKSVIVASNDINEQVLWSLREQGHEINSMGIGTNLVTCEKQPALGCVYKLVEINGRPRIKLSQDPGKMTIPGSKTPYRLFGADGYALVDIMMQDGEPAPRTGERILCRHPSDPTKRVYVTPSAVEPLHYLVFDSRRRFAEVPIEALRTYVQEQLKAIREDHRRPLNPAAYKVTVSEQLFAHQGELWEKEAPIAELA